MLFLYVCADISSWLQLFGFQLHNVVPGFSKPEVSRLEQTYELMKTQTQNWDSSKVSLLSSFLITPLCNYMHLISSQDAVGNDCNYLESQTLAHFNLGQKL